MTKPTDRFPATPSVITTPTQGLIDALRFATVSGASVVGMGNAQPNSEVTSLLASINSIVDPKDLADMRQALTQIRQSDTQSTNAALPPKATPSDRGIS